MLEGLDVFEWVNDDLVDGMVHRLYLDVYERLFHVLLILLHSEYNQIISFQNKSIKTESIGFLIESLLNIGSMCFTY